MSDLDKEVAAGNAELSIGQAIGLSTPEGTVWSRVHGHQYARLGKRIAVRAASHAVAFLLVVLILWNSVDLALIGAWGLALGFAVILSMREDRIAQSAETVHYGIHEMRRHAVASAAKGTVWGIGLMLFAESGGASQLAIVWSVPALLILATAASRYSAPLGSISFTIAAGIGGLFAATLAADWMLVVVITFTVLFAVFGTIENARVAVAGRVHETVMQEKSEVVSMLLREFEENQADWLWQIDPRRRLKAVSPRFAYALGCEASEAEGKLFFDLISGRDWSTNADTDGMREFAEKLKRKEPFSELIVRVNIRGLDRWWEISGTPMLDDAGKFIGFRGVGSDVTEQRESSEKIAYLARYDTLTQLPNRLMLNESLGEALEYAAHWRTRCAFLMIDLDRFKAVNDSLGHLIGDQMLAQVAGRLKSLMGEGELCGRLGGDEFAIVIRDASNRKRVDALARAVIEQLSEPYQIDNQILYVGASVGSAIGPRDGKSVEEMLRNADLALYRAKDLGGGEHCEYEPSLHANAEEKRQLEFSLRKALEREELLLHYQPVVDATTEEVVSFEALVRWNSSDHGFVSPGKFIPLAEDTRLIVPIGTWVMQEACKEAAANWPRNVKVNINVSPEQLLEPEFASTVVRALSHSGLDPRRLEIEVTESIFLRDASIARKALEQCMSLGCSVALDDFGTGYSSLGYLRKLKFSTIKVDRSFVQGAAQQSRESLAIIRAVVAMAESLDMTTTAEGVETEEEAEMIRSLRCNKIQGFHFGRPMPAAEARKVFLRGAVENLRKSA
ncbi:EAL domain-containing protein [Qipengyuania sp. XHP0207]|uniref:putative bifunctional diguanylate cyclase/phosphodiesterase n=1 Tax=Qipengyuania sp. XHP0207 TaxID=3038078 RepID=UPI00241CFC28|nr:EAL domain-containing protein [Qipengyuania sp. XHP0207]MDG5748832.1 EAL domain-containing protein [Qipengyuania sp. XHP0207]